MAKTKWRLRDSGIIVLPQRFLKEMGVDDYQPFEITVEFGRICIKPFYYKDIENKPFIGIIKYIMDRDSHRITIPREYLEVLGFECGRNYKLTLVDNTIIMSDK